MAISTNSPEKTTTEQPPGPDNPNPPNSDLPASSAAPPSATPATAGNAVAVGVNPNPSVSNLQSAPSGIAPPPQIQSFAPPSQVATGVPTFRPAAPPVPLPSAPQFSPIPNAGFQSHGIQVQGQVQVQVQPPGVMMPPPSQSSGPVMMPPQYGQPGQQPMRMYAPMPNGYQMNPPGIIRYAPPPYPQMMRPAYPQRPIGVIPALPRPPMMAMRAPVIPTIIRPPINLNITPTEKPMTTVYVGKIASTVDNDFMLSLLQLCGPVKSWKRVPDPTTGALKGFGFCEFESVEGVLRALRLLSKLSIDGQELMLNFDKATKEYLKRFVEKKKEKLKNSKTTDSEKNEPSKPSIDESKNIIKKEEDNNNEANKESDDYSSFGLVTDEDKESDREANEKLKGMIEERIKNKPLPPPPPPPQNVADVAVSSASEHPARSRDGDSDVDMRNAEDKNENEKTETDSEKPETSSPDRNRRSKDRDRERDQKREKERELERYEREREQERAKREREREYKIREDERRYRARLKEWESREKEKERSRKQEREREKDREQDRKYEILDQENDDQGYNGKKRKYRNNGEEREERKRRLREKEEDYEDRIKEEEEIVEAKKKEEIEKERMIEQQKHALEILSSNVVNGSENVKLADEIRSKGGVEKINDVEMADGNEIGNKLAQNGTNDTSTTSSDPTRQNNTIPTKKLGFGLVGSGKRTAVASLFVEEEDEDGQKDKKMRPLIPIDYSTEELQAVKDTTTNTPLAPSPLTAAAEFAKRIGNVNSKDEGPDLEKDRSRRAHRDRDRKFEEDSRVEKAKTPDKKKLLDAKQLIDTIPKTKDELFSYPINWTTYDKNGLHERMRPWISKKITEFLGEEETTLVDYIVSSTQEHVTADEMLERLQSILDDEAEMFVLKMWRMLIFEIKKVESGLTGRSKA